jgi:hypothetical protein
MNTELLHCSPKITTTLLIRYTPIQTVFDIKKLKLKTNISEVACILYNLNVNECQ